MCRAYGTASAPSALRALVIQLRTACVDTPSRSAIVSIATPRRYMRRASAAFDECVKELRNGAGGKLGGDALAQDPRPVVASDAFQPLSQARKGMLIRIADADRRREAAPREDLPGVEVVGRWRIRTVVRIASASRP